MTQVAREPLDRLQDLFGGWVKARKKPTATGRIAHDWTLSSATALREVIPQLLPYLTVKRSQAEALLEYANLMRPDGGGSYRLTDKECDARKIVIARFEQAKATQYDPLPDAGEALIGLARSYA